MTGGSSQMRVVVFDVGQGDCVLLGFPGNGWGLVDCHRKSGESEPPVVRYMRDNNITDLEFICLTHPDYDHFKGMVDVIDYVVESGGHVKRFWMFGGTKVSPKRIYQEFQRAMFMVRRSGDGVGPDDRDIVTQEEVNYNGQRVVEFSRLLERVLNWIRTDDLERRRPPEAQDARKRFWYSRLVGPNEVRSFGDARVYCLGPTSDMVERYETSLGMGLMVNNPFRRQTTDERSPTGEPETNSLSIVIGIEFGGTVLILGGDAGRRQWKGIFAALEDKDRSYPVEGQFVKATLTLAGQWDMRIFATKQGTDFQSARRVMIP